ncbi:hypothetical protein M413DRAFT_22037 [Hebeloma cylindrosporum]|uniref:Ubiquitin-like protease family profile domain-containing protein n=1 Tax=Hebeloma cylindrosporum TaxID=76867 RepID=A0A0C2YJI1_HEBCY|nr:hypothetical protein M413DRAFT_22037 [Hebeloma cylindrosporum h7]
MRKKTSKPTLSPSTTSGTMTGAHALIAMSAVVLLVFFISQPFAVRYIIQLSRQQPEGAKSTALGLVLICFEFLLTAVSLFLPCRFRTLLFFGLEIRTYRRTHIAHMRIDRIIIATWLSHIPAWPFTPSILSVPFANSFCGTTFPVRITGGGAGDGVHNNFQGHDIMDLTTSDVTEIPGFDHDPFAPTQCTPAWLSNLVIPPSESSVLDLLDVPFPTTESAMPTPIVSHDAPNVFLDPLLPANDRILFDHPFLLRGKPLCHAIKRLDLQQAWLSGCRSIAFDNSPSRYPFWIASFIHELDTYRVHCVQWESACQWLSTTGLSTSSAAPETPDIIDECRLRLGAIPWRGDVPGFGKAVQFGASHLSSFLSNSWLDDEMINASSDWILKERGGASNHIQIINCLHLQQLQRAHHSDSTYIPLNPIDTLIQSCNVDIILLPLHVYGNHWTLLCINFLDSTYSYADCLHQHESPPTTTFSLIEWWLNSLLPSIPPLVAAPFEFDLPRQLDSFSCGIIVLDIMANLVLDYPLWAQNRAAVHRMEWFLRLSNIFDDLEASNLGGSDDESDNSSLKSTSPSSPHSSSPSNALDSPNILSPKYAPSIEGKQSSRKRSHTYLRAAAAPAAGTSSGDESDSHEGRYLARRRGTSNVNLESSWSVQKRLRDHAKQSKLKPAQILFWFDARHVQNGSLCVLSMILGDGGITDQQANAQKTELQV